MRDDINQAIARSLAIPAQRRVVVAGAAWFVLGAHAALRDEWSAMAKADPLPSWNDGAAKQAILDFVAAATAEGSETFVPPAERIATFDQDGTLWVEHPVYTQAIFAIDRIKTLAPDHPEWATTEPYKTVLADDTTAMAKFTEEDWAQIVGTTHAGMSVDDFISTAAAWAATAQHPKFGHRYTELVYQPMLEVMALLQENGFRTYIVSGGGQEFIRAFAGDVYGLPPEQVIGTTFETKYDTGSTGAPLLIKEAKLQLNNNNAGKPQDINLFLGRRPVAAFGNSTGDQQMLEWTAGGDRAHLEVLIYHDDAEREYAYGPAGGLADTQVGTLTQDLMNEARQDGWTVVSMKTDWNRIFPWST